MEHAQESVFWGDFEHLNDTLKESLKQLGKFRKDKEGLSEDFLKQLQSPVESLALCEKAMRTLANEYTAQIEIIKDATESKSVLRALNEAENIWDKESVVIKQADKTGDEKKFLLQMRGHYLSILNNKLEEVAKQCRQQNTPENVALYAGIMIIMDKIWNEFDQPVTHPQRQLLRRAVKMLK